MIDNLIKYHADETIHCGRCGFFHKCNANKFAPCEFFVHSAIMDAVQDAFREAVCERGEQ